MRRSGVALVGLCTLIAACATSPKPRALDGDGDGIPDDLDLCPTIAEDNDGVDDRDGCPEYPAGTDGGAPASPSLLEIFGDDDRDGIDDRRDACPHDAEDKDGFEDDDGCPDPDNDRDRVPDVDDKCPNEPETYNNQDDDDGCPDKSTTWGWPGSVKFVDVPFVRGHAGVEFGAVPIVDGLAEVIQKRCLTVELQGHASDDERRPRALAAARAAAVRAAVIARGVWEEAVKVRSSGATKPLCREPVEACRTYNRRVTIEVIETRDCRPRKL